MAIGPRVFPLQLAREVERMFEELIHQPWGVGRELRGLNPSLDMYEEEDSFVLEADLPGMRREDVEITVQDDELILRGRRTLEKSQSGGRFYAMERYSGQFTRRIKLPEAVDKNAIETEFEAGVLRVRIGKSLRGERK